MEEKEAPRLEAVFLDLDGSLLNQDRQVGGGDRRAVRLLREAGVHVYLATGRHYELSARFHRELGLTEPFLASDGAVLYDRLGDRVLYRHPIPPDLTGEILRIARERGEEFYFHDTHAAYFSPNFGRLYVWQNYAAGCTPEDRMPGLGGFPEGYLSGKQEVMTFMTHHPSPEFLECLTALCRGRAPLYIQPEGRLAVVSSPGWDKGRGAWYLAQTQGFSLENALGLGDSSNDLALLKAVGWPVSPQSGDPEARALARFITSHHNQNPLAFAVQSLFPQYGV